MRQRGFTMVELIVVIIIGSILAVYAAPRFTSKAFDARAAAGELAEAIRYAQEMSMVHSGALPYRIELLADGYTVTQSGVDIIDPATRATPYAQSWSGIGLNHTGIISFDSRGQPTCSGALAACSAPGDSDLTIAVSAGSDSVSVRMARLTGYAHVQ